VKWEQPRAAACLSDLVLDRIVAGELKPTGAPATHLERCHACRARLSALLTEAQRFPDEVFVAGMAAAARRRARPPRLRIVGALSALAAGAAALVLALRPAAPPPPSSVRTKGGLQLELVARHADGRVERVLPEAVLHPGEAIRFRISSDADGWLAVVGVDGARQVTPYVPPSGRCPRTAPARDRLLDGSVILDDTLGVERIFASLCPREVAVAEVVAAARRALDQAGGDPAHVGDLGIGCRQASVLIRKTPQP